MPTPANASPRFFVGIDGGGTGTRARLADAQGRLLGWAEAGPSSLSQGITQAWTHVQLATARAFESAGLALPEPALIGLGLGLAGAHAPAQVQAFRHVAPGYAALAIDTDAGTTLWGAHAGQPGAIVAAGTGSVGEALTLDGRRISAGGWGFGVGDEGSGAWMGLHAMQIAQQAMDGRMPAGPLAMAVWRVAGGHREALFDWCADAGQHGYARLAPLVFEAVDADTVARRLIERAADELVSLALALDPAAQLPLTITGSVGLRLKPWMPTTLLERCVEPAGDSAQGALHLIQAQLQGSTGSGQ
jgi:glucosamine kinase